MEHHFLELAHPTIQHLKPYLPGKPINELRRELGISNIIKLASNENPLGASKKAIEGAMDALHEIALYPDANGYELKHKLSEHLHVSVDELTLGNGSDSLFTLIAHAFVPKGKEVIVSQHAFIAFAITAHVVEAALVKVPAQDFGHDLARMAANITKDTRLIFIANPNNPTGTWVTHQELQTFLEQIPKHVFVVLDEAYYEFMDQPDYPRSLQLQKRFPNLIITRTFSKVYGLASLRVGYAIAHPEITDILNRIRNPFNVSSPGLKAATFALDDQDFVEKTLQNNQQGMHFLRKEFDAMGISYLPPTANFITIDVGQHALALYDALLQLGVIVRPIHNYEMPQYLRITIGLPEQNQRLIESLKSAIVKV